MNPIVSTPLPDPCSLHPALWRARGGQAAPAQVCASGFAALDAELPGGGWPQRALTELLLPGPGLGEWRLLAPALARLAAHGRSVMLFNPPARPSAEALAELGLPPSRCLVVQARAPERPVAGATARRPPGAPVEVCWALEQALRSGQLGAVVAWPGAAARPDILRRWQLAAQSHPGPAFLLREPAAATRPSPAPLRLSLTCLGPDRLGVQLLKRRGPVLDQTLALALPPVLSSRALARAAQPWPLPSGRSASDPVPSRQPAAHRADPSADPSAEHPGDRVGEGLAAVPGTAAWLTRLGASAAGR
jgi:protein ImuA